CRRRRGRQFASRRVADFYREPPDKQSQGAPNEQDPRGRQASSLLHKSPGYCCRLWNRRILKIYAFGESPPSRSGDRGPRWNRSQVPPLPWQPLRSTPATPTVRSWVLMLKVTLGVWAWPPLIFSIFRICTTTRQRKPTLLKRRFQHKMQRASNFHRRPAAKR